MKAAWMIVSIFGVVLSGLAQAADSAKAQLELVSAKTPIKAGESVLLGLRMKIEPGWHTYWVNPGESGMKPAIEWKLPAGFGPVRVGFPFPHAFQAGEMLSYGYEGEVVFPVWIDWPEKLTELPTELTFGVQMRWLTCSADACLPGYTNTAIILPVGDPAPTAAAEAIAAAIAQTPAVQEGWKLVVAEANRKVLITLHAPKGLNLAKATVFPISEQALDFRTPLVFAPGAAPDSWTAEVPVNEFAAGPLKSLELAVKTPEGRPVLVTWSAQ